MKIKLIYLTTIIALTILNNNSFSQTADKASEIISKIQNTFSSSENYCINFYVSVDNEMTDTKGVITINKDKYNVNIDDNTIIFDGVNIYNYSKRNNEVTIERPKSNGSFSGNPKEVFELDINKFNVLSNVDTLLNGVKSNIITLSPKNKALEIENIVVTIQKDNSIPSELTLKPNNSNVIHLRIQKALVNIVPEPELFIFDDKKYKNIEIIDFR